MSELSDVQESILIECLRLLDAGAGVEACLERYPDQAGLLRPYLDFHARLLALQVPPPSATAFQAGRQALLSQLVGVPAPARAARRVPLLGALVDGWRGLGSPIARLAAVAAAIAVLGFGALGVSAASGVRPARDVLSALHVAPAPSHNGGEAAPTAAGQSNGTATPSAPTEEATSSTPPQQIPGAGLCFEERQHAPDLPADVLQHVPNAGLCVPDALLEHPPEGRPCVPPALLDRFPALREVVGEAATCGGGEQEQPSSAEPGEPPGTLPAPTERPHGPPESDETGPSAHPTPTNEPAEDHAPDRPLPTSSAEAGDHSGPSEDLPADPPASEH